MKRTWIIAMAALSCGRGGSSALTPAGTSPVPPAPTAEGLSALDGEDVLDEMRRMNGDEYTAPPTTFRPGHVTPRTLDASAFARAKGSFAVTFPSKAPLTTPAVHDGKVFTSGGFKGKEFYAIDAKSGELVWGLDLDDDGPSSAACASGRCVFNTESCTIFTVDADTGELLWSYWLGDPLTSSPAVASGRVFSSYPVMGGGANMNFVPNDNLNYDALNGNVSPTPVATGGKTAPPGATHALAAFDLETGAILWQRWLDSDVMSAPVVVGDHVYVATFAGTLLELEAASGEILAARRARATSAPVVVDGALYYTRRTDTDGRAVEALVRQDVRGANIAYKANERSAPYLDRAVQSVSGYAAFGLENDSANGFSSGAPASANPRAAEDNIGQANVSTLQAFQGSRVLHHEDRTYSTMGDEIVATDAATGEVVWRRALDGDLATSGGFLASPPVAAGDQLVVATLAGDVLVLDPDDGKVRATHAIGSPIRSQPVVEAGWIYVGTEDGRLVGIDTGDATLTGWTMWGGNAARTGLGS